MPESLAHQILLSLSKFTCLKRIGVESRREHVSVERLKKARACLRPDQRLSLLFGYESSREDVRNTRLRKDVPEKYLDDVLELCRETQVDLGAYVLIKPPGLTEAEAIDDAVNTAVHVMQKAQRQNVEATIHFNPMFVAQGTLLEKYYLAGQYKPPRLWSVVEVIKRTAKALGLSNTLGKIFVGLSDENLSGGRMFGNCGACDEQVILEIQEFNGHQDVTRLGKTGCACRGRWGKEIGSSVLY